jgi:general secretion pathway protein J
MRTPRPRDGGFTLVEALVSLFVFSLLASGCVAMLMQSVESQRRVDEAHQALRQLQTARALLTSDMAQMVLRDVREREGRRPRFIGGDEDVALGFVRAGAEPDGAGGTVVTLSLVEYRLVEDRVVRATRLELDTPGDMVERVVVSGVNSARVEFFDGAGWRQNWVAPASGGPPPRAVALIVDMPRYGEVRIEALVGLGR